MKGDFSRETFDASKRYAGVQLQQGRVQLDADWNEQQSIHRHRTTTESRDVVGASGAPLHDAGFLISTPDGKALNIGRGRYYVNGLLCENESDIGYAAQPDFPSAPDVIAALTAAQAKAAVIYLDVCYRHITAIDDPFIREVALGGPDTTTRIKTMWQVKALPIKSAGGVSCGDTLTEWDALVTRSSGMLSARAQPTQSTDNPCLLPPSAGYRRLENQLYRVEVHSGGDLGAATFKWSRDNGSIVTAIETINGQDVTVRDLGRDDILGFSGGQFVEITDDVHELSGQPGQLVQIDRINTATRVITVRPAPTGMDTKRAKLRRWDGTGASSIAIPATNGGWIPLEDGVEVLFAQGTYVAGDYWVIPARTVTGNVEWPFASPQRSKGIAHHYSRLAIATLTGSTLALQDCRRIFSPLSERPPALHVTAINWLNDDVISQDLIQSNGLQVFFDGPVTLPATDSVLGIVAVFLEMPLVLKADATVAAGPAEAQMAGQFTAILNGDLSFPAPTTLQWKPSKNAAEFKSLASLLANQRISRVRMRFLLKGHALWGERDTGFLYLDGHALGQPGFRADGKARIDLKFPSGDNRRSSDFESWFYLQLQIPASKLIGLTLSSPTVIAGSPVTGTVMLDFPSAAASNIKLTTSAAQVTIPAGSVTIPAGQTQITFQVITAAALPSTLDVIITATLSAGGVDTSLQAPLKVQVVSVTIAPAEMSLFTSHSQQFTVNVIGAENKAVNWSVQEAGGGGVNTSGLYTAPATVGTFHVVATSVADSSKKATAIVHVTLKLKDKEKEKEKEFVREVDPKLFAMEVSNKTIRDVNKIREINNLGGLMPAAGQPILLRNAEAAFDNPAGRAFIRPAERPETTPFAANP